MNISNSLFWVAAIVFLVIWLLVDAPRFKLVMLGGSGLLLCLFYSPVAAITVVTRVTRRVLRRAVEDEAAPTS